MARQLPPDIWWVIVRWSGLTMGDTARLALGGDRQLRQMHDDHVDHWLAACAAVARPNTTAEWVRRHGIVRYARARTWRSYREQIPLLCLARGVAGYALRVEEAVLSQEAVAEFIDAHRERSRRLLVDVAAGNGNVRDQVAMLTRPGEMALLDWDGEPAALVVGGCSTTMPRNLPITELLAYHDVQRHDDDGDRRWRMKLTMIAGVSITDLEGHVAARLAAAGVEKTGNEGSWYWRSGEWDIFVCKSGMGRRIYAP